MSTVAKVKSPSGTLSTAEAISVMTNGLSLAGIEVDRKVLADLAVNEPDAFSAIVDKAKAALG